MRQRISHGYYLARCDLYLLFSFNKRPLKTENFNVTVSQLLIQYYVWRGHGQETINSLFVYSWNRDHFWLTFWKEWNGPLPSALSFLMCLTGHQHLFLLRVLSTIMNMQNVNNRVDMIELRHDKTANCPFRHNHNKQSPIRTRVYLYTICAYLVP